MHYRFARALKRSSLTLENDTAQPNKIGNSQLPEQRFCEAASTAPEQNDNFIIQPPEKRFCEAATQIDFYEEEIRCTHINMFSMIRENGDTCDSATQANIALKRSEKIIISPRNTSEVGCGTTIEYADKNVGPSPSVDDDSLLGCQQGFRGFSSIKDDRDLIDLAGVSFTRFKLLKTAAGNFYKGSASNDNLLLIFLVKMKLGLTYSSIGVLFGMHRTTISRIFHAYLMYLAQSCSTLVQWPSKLVIENTMPASFKKRIF